MLCHYNAECQCTSKQKCLYSASGQGTERVRGSAGSYWKERKKEKRTVVGVAVHSERKWVANPFNMVPEIFCFVG